MKKARKTLFRKWALIIVTMAIVFSVAYSFYRYFIQGDYLLYVKVPCDSTLEKCFIHECDLDDVRCSGLQDQKYYYKIIMKKAYNIEKCETPDCAMPSCSPGEESCQTFYCSNDNLLKFDLDDLCNP